MKMDRDQIREKPHGLHKRVWLWSGSAVLVIICGVFLLSRFLPTRTDTAFEQGGLLRLSRQDRAKSAASEPFTEEAAQSAPVSAARKVISTASLEIRVGSAEQAADTLAGMAIASGGFVQSSGTSTLAGERHGAEMVLRIPTGRFQIFLTAAGRLGRVSRKEVMGQDVTEEYIDLEARLRNWENQEKQLTIIMTRAKTVGEVLTVQAELGRIRETIEQIQGKIKYYDYNVALATVTVTFYEGSAPAEPVWIVGEIGRLLAALYGSIRFLILTLLVLIPWLLAGWALWAIGRRVYAKHWK